MTEVPNNIDAERACLGSLLIGPENLWTVRQILTGPKSFMRDDHGWIYEALCKVDSSGTAIDFVTVCSALDDMGRAVGDKNDKGDAYITFLINSVPTAMHAEDYARIVETKYQSRQLISAAGKIAKIGYDADDAVEAHAMALETLHRIAPRQRSRGPRSMNTIVDDSITRIQSKIAGDKEALGLSTGFIDLDRVLGRLEKGKLIVIAGRPGMGKSALVMKVGYNVAKIGKSVFIFSAEMDEEELLLRMACREAEVDKSILDDGTLRDINPQGEGKLWGAIRKIQDLPLWVDDQPAITTATMRLRLAQFVTRHPLDLVITDYIQCLGDPGNNPVQVVGNIAKAHKNIAREYDVPVIAVSQLSRACESRKLPIPRLSDLRESGTIEQEADVVTFLYRDDYYSGMGRWPPKPKEYNICHVHTAKRRGGATGKRPMVFRPEYTLFLDLEPGAYTYGEPGRQQGTSGKRQELEAQLKERVLAF